MQKPKLVDNATAGLEFQDSSTALALDGTILRAIFQNDNFGNIFKLIENAGYTLIDDDLSQIVKAVKGLYSPSFTYNTSAIATQTINDIVLGSDGKHYEAQSDAISGDDPVGSITGNWEIAPINTDRVPKTGVQDTEDWEGTAYADPDVVGGATNPTAKIFPDGRVEGSTDNYNRYIKYPSGYGEVVGFYNTGASGSTLNMPIALISERVYSLTPVSSAQRTVVLGSVTTINFAVKGYNDTALADVGFYYIIKGRWK